MGYIDFHTHILPEMDDGAKSVGESLEMLKAAHLSGAQTVLLTPHFLTRRAGSRFLCAAVQQIFFAEKSDGGRRRHISNAALRSRSAPLRRPFRKQRFGKTVH